MDVEALRRQGAMRSLRVCSAHFVDNDFFKLSTVVHESDSIHGRHEKAHFEESAFEQNRADDWKKLKPNAVPTLFSFRAMPKHRKPPKEWLLPQGAPAAEEGTHTLQHRPSASVTSPTDIQDQHVNDVADIPEAANQELLRVPSDGTEMAQRQMNNLPRPSSTPETSVPATDSQKVAGPLNAIRDEWLGEKFSNSSGAEVNKQLEDMKRKYAKLQEVHSKASATNQSIK
ncbi:uncharacterized protein [Dermacentor andersoni]|uniref:uncharacterized protein isoform X1 n=1 Tax=Dermacentor andersoni TaxID=34620 RepID=UPI003B3AA034